MNISDLQQIYRNQNIRAFLQALRLGEGTDNPDGYSEIVGGGNFEDFSHHPHVKVFIPKYGLWSTAAGAYQIIYPTWVGLQKQYGFPDFSPDYQDLAAVALIVECHAVDDIKAGQLQSAIRKCARIWASLPGSTAGQRTELYANIEEEFIMAGGVLA